MIPGVRSPAVAEGIPALRTDRRSSPEAEPCGPLHCRKPPRNSRSSLGRTASGSTPTWRAASPTIPAQVIQKVIDAEAVLVNGRSVKASYRVRAGDRVCIRLPELPDTTPEAGRHPDRGHLRR